MPCQLIMKCIRTDTLFLCIRFAQSPILCTFKIFRKVRFWSVKRIKLSSSSWQLSKSYHLMKWSNYQLCDLLSPCPSSAGWRRRHDWLSCQTVLQELNYCFTTPWTRQKRSWRGRDTSVNRGSQQRTFRYSEIHTERHQLICHNIYHFFLALEWALNTYIPNKCYT